MRLRVAREELADARCRLENRAGDLSRAARRRLDAAARGLSPARVATAASRARVRLTVSGAALEASAHARLEDARSRMAVAAAALDAMSPLAVLGRGYALAQDGRGRVLRSARGVGVGDGVRVRLASGALRCRVESVEGEN
jgi:exodeoxyribonuclease VII large subunit